MNPTETDSNKTQTTREPYILQGTSGKDMLSQLLLEIGIKHPKFRIANETGAAAESGSFVFSLTKHEKEGPLGNLYKIRVQQSLNGRTLSNLFFWSLNKDFDLYAFKKSYLAMARLADVIPIQTPTA
jgi:hypothetical protein